MSRTKANLTQRVKYFEAVMSAKLELIREKYRHSVNSIRFRSVNHDDFSVH